LAAPIVYETFVDVKACSAVLLKLIAIDAVTEIATVLIDALLVAKVRVQGTLVYICTRLVCVEYESTGTITSEATNFVDTQ